MSDTQATGDVAVETTAADSADGSTAAATGVKDATDTTTTTEATSDTASDASTENTATATEETEQTEPSDADVASKDADGTEDDDAEDTPAGEKSDKPSRVRQLEREGEVAADFLETLLDIADLDGDIDGDRAAVAIGDSEDGRVPRRLVGPGGKVLEALQELTRVAVQVETGERSRLMLDIAGHRAERRSTLVDLAKTAIEQVKASGEKSALEPMSAFERKVVHDEVAAAGLVSESEGVEPNRHVVILPA